MPMSDLSNCDLTSDRGDRRTTPLSFTIPYRRNMDKPVKVLLLDGDGVIWIDKTPIPGAIESLNKIRAFGIRLVLVTNNCSKTREQYLKFMEAMGLEGFTAEDVFSSGYATAMFLIKNNIKSVFVCGFRGLSEELRLHGIEVHTTETDPELVPVDAVVVAKSDTFGYDELARGMTLVVKHGARLIGTNPDPNFPLAHGVLVPGSGGSARTFEEGTGKKATLIGKPEDPMFNTMLESLGVGADDVVMVGDRLITDIAFAGNHNARSIMVLSGVDTKEMAEEATGVMKPTWVLPSLVECVELLRPLAPK